MCLFHTNFTAAALLAFASFFTIKKKKLYKAVMEGFWLVGELESCLSGEGLEAAGAPLDAAKQPKQN